MTELSITQNGESFCCLGIGENVSVGGFCSIAIGDGTRAHGDFVISYSGSLTIDGDVTLHNKILGVLIEKAVLYSYIYPPEKRSYAQWVIQQAIDDIMKKIHKLRTKT